MYHADGCSWLFRRLAGYRYSGDLSYRPVKTLAAGRPATKTVEQKRPIGAYQVILDRNIFDSTGAVAPGCLEDGSAGAAALASLG